MSSDVFISYSHRDDEFPYGWVSHLGERLKTALGTLAPSTPISVCMDKLDVRRDENFSDRIRDLLDESQILLCVVSQSFITSNYCSTEIDYFMRRSRVGRPCFARIVKNPVSVTQQHEALQRCIGHDFYDRQTGGEHPTRTADDKPHPTFEMAISRLAHEIIDRVRGGRVPRQKLFLFAPAEREDEGTLLAGTLRNDGVEVFTGRELPSAQKERRAAIDRYPHECDFTLLLLGNRYSDEIARIYAILDHRWSGPDRRCLFGKPRFEIVDPLQVQFLKSLDHASDAFDFVEGPADILPETRRFLKALVERASRVPTLFLAYSKSSRAKAEALRKEIQSTRTSAGQPIVVLDPYGDGGPQLRTETFAKDISLQRAHGALILSESEGAYLENILGDIEGRPGPSNCVAVYAPNQTARVPFGIRTRYPIIQGVAPPPVYEWLTADTKTVTLTEFLSSVEAQAIVS